MPLHQFNNRTAIFLASVCSQAYTHFNDPDGQFVVPIPFEYVTDFHARSLTGRSEKFGFILQSDDHIIIAFRGTSTTSDWISDAMASQIKFKFARNAGMTHRGFSNIYESAREPILEALDGLDPNKDLYITGHSLGGALTSLCGLDVAVNSSFSYPIAYTFGSPRVGDPTFAKAYDSQVCRSFRVQNPLDAVTHLPPQTFTLPKRDKTFYYMHVRENIPLPFHNSSVSANHIISGYFSELAKRDPLFTELLQAYNPGFCPHHELVTVSSSATSFNEGSVSANLVR
ncbi:lipase family protein [Cohnella sp. WQ 127256]|uniref:lipase family protein n=1 Tax=Cohnella sp. WQ 127256 TaxID=2938790 RepID=UPI0021178788|nr:lipase family protein [Cohnella sp. WQ 127256]